jgi:hypothetical protein
MREMSLKRYVALQNVIRRNSSLNSNLSVSYDLLEEIWQNNDDMEFKVKVLIGYIRQRGHGVDVDSLSKFFATLNESVRSNVVLLYMWQRAANLLPKDLIQLLPYLDDNFKKGLLYIKELHELPEEELLTLIRLTPSVTQKAEITKAWLSNDCNKLPFAQLKKILLQINARDANLSEDDFGAIATAWLARDDNNFSFTELKELLQIAYQNDSYSSYSTYRYLIVQIWLSKPNNNLTSAELNELLPFVQTSQDKEMLIKQWLAKDNVLTFAQLLGELPKSASGYDQVKLAVAFINDNSTAIEKLEQILPLIANKKRKVEVITAWLKTAEGKRLRKDTLMNTILPLHTDVVSKRLLIKEWVRNISDAEMRYQQAIALLAEVSEHMPHIDLFPKWHQVALYFKKYAAISKERVPQLCRDLYPDDEASQCQLFATFLVCKDPFTADQPLLQKDCMLIIREFLNGVKDDGNALLIVKAMIGARISIDITDIGNRVDPKFASLKQLITAKSLKEALTTDGLDIAKELFGDDIENKESFATLFTCYQLFNNSAGFLNIIKPAVYVEINSSYKPLASDVLVIEEEAASIEGVTGVVLPSMEILTNAIKLAAKPRDIDSANYCINFGDDKRSQQVKEKLNEGFRKLLNQQASRRNLVNNSAEIITYFKELFALENNVDYLSIAALGDWVIENITELAHVLQCPGKFASFAKLIRDYFNCPSNKENGDLNRLIMDQYYRAVITSPSEAVLYSVVAQATGKAIARYVVGKNDLITLAWNIGEDKLTSSFVNRAAVAPNALFIAIQAEFATGYLIKAKDFIASEIGKARAARLNVVSDAQAGRIAAYLLMKNTVPELMASQYLNFEIDDLVALVLSEFDVAIDLPDFIDDLKESINMYAISNEKLEHYIRDEAIKVMERNRLLMASQAQAAGENSRKERMCNIALASLAITVAIEIIALATAPVRSANLGLLGLGIWISINAAVYIALESDKQAASLGVLTR